MKTTIKMAFNLPLVTRVWKTAVFQVKKRNFKYSTIFQATADFESYLVLCSKSDESIKGGHLTPVHGGDVARSLLHQFGRNDAL